MVLSAWTAVFFAWFFLCLFVSMPRWVWQGDTFPPRPKVWEVLTFISNHSMFKEWECLRGFNFHVHFQSFPFSESESAWEVSICIFHFQSFPFSESESVWEVFSAISISIISIFTKWDCLSGFIGLKNQCCKSLWIWKFFDYRLQIWPKPWSWRTDCQTERSKKFVSPKVYVEFGFGNHLLFVTANVCAQSPKQFGSSEVSDLNDMSFNSNVLHVSKIDFGIVLWNQSIDFGFFWDAARRWNCRKSTLELSCGTNRSTLDFFWDAARCWNCRKISVSTGLRNCFFA